MSRPTRDGTAEPVSRDQILRREGGQGNIHFPCSADHYDSKSKDQPHPVGPYSCYYICDTVCDVMTIHTLQPGLMFLFFCYFSIGTALRDSA